MDNTRKFDGRAADYLVGRPSYADELTDSILESCELIASSAVADVGSGTGKFSECLLRRGATLFGKACTVCGVEPNEAMRLAAERELVGYTSFRSVAGSAESTTLADRSVDCVTAAQAFHWFDAEVFGRECRRILKDNGRVCLVWNVRDAESTVMRELARVYSELCPEFRGFSCGFVRDDARISKFFGGRYGYISFDNPQHLDEKKFIVRSLSSSYSLREGDARFEEYVSCLKEVFDSCAENGVLTLPCRSEAYFGRLD